MSAKNPPFRVVGTPAYHMMSQVSTSTGAVAYFGRVSLEGMFSKFALRVCLTGTATSGEWQLRGTVGSSSDLDTVLKPLTTWLGSAQASNDVVYVTDKPVNQIVIAQTTPSSSGTQADVWVGANP